MLTSQVFLASKTQCPFSTPVPGHRTQAPHAPSHLPVLPLKCSPGARLLLSAALLPVLQYLAFTLLEKKPPLLYLYKSGLGLVGRGELISR